MRNTNRRNNDVYEIIAANIKVYRKKAKITQAELARVFDLKPTTVASWEQGKSLPSIAMLYRLAAYYKKTIGYMYGEKEDADKLWQTRDYFQADHIKQGLQK